MSTADVAKRYFQALAAQDLDTAAECWEPGAIDRFVGQEELVAPDGVREYFTNVFHAFPDFTFEVIEMTTSHSRTAVRWRARATFAGPGTFQGFEPNGAWLELEGCDVLTVHEDRITHNDAYMDTGAIARQLGFLPPPGSKTESRLVKLANARTRIRNRVHGNEAEQIADGVYRLRGGIPGKAMNVYLLEDAGGVTLFDSGSSDMVDVLAAAGARLGGIRRVVLGHADCDHRGSAPRLHAPVYCHPDDRDAAPSPSAHRTYWDYSKLSTHGRWLRKMNEVWDGGPVGLAGTVEEGEEIAGFKVIHLPGHAPGQIGLFREQDRLALVSDLVYTLDPQTGIKGPPRVPHPAFNIDSEQARDSIRKLAAMSPSSVWAGHAEPVKEDVVAQLERAASAPLPA